MSDNHICLFQTAKSLLAYTCYVFEFYIIKLCYKPELFNFSCNFYRDNNNKGFNFFQSLYMYFSYNVIPCHCAGLVYSLKPNILVLEKQIYFQNKHKEKSKGQRHIHVLTGILNISSLYIQKHTVKKGRRKKKTRRIEDICLTIDKKMIRWEEQRRGTYIIKIRIVFLEIWY